MSKPRIFESGQSVKNSSTGRIFDYVGSRATVIPYEEEEKKKKKKKSPWQTMSSAFQMMRAPTKPIADKGRELLEQQKEIFGYVKEDTQRLQAEAARELAELRNSEDYKRYINDPELEKKANAYLFNKTRQHQTLDMSNTLKPQSEMFKSIDNGVDPEVKKYLDLKAKETGLNIKKDQLGRKLQTFVGETALGTPAALMTVPDIALDTASSAAANPDDFVEGVGLGFTDAVDASAKFVQQKAIAPIESKLTGKEYKALLDEKYRDMPQVSDMLFGKWEERMRNKERSESEQKSFASGQGLGGMGPTVVVSSVLGPVAGKVVFGTKAHQMNYEKAISEGKTELEANTFATVMTVAELALESLGFDSTTLKMQSNLVKTGFGEFVEEFSIGPIEAITRKIMFKEDTNTQELLTSSIEEGVQGFFLGIVMGSSNVALSKIAEKINTKKPLTEAEKQAVIDEIERVSGQDVDSIVEEIAEKSVKELSDAGQIEISDDLTKEKLELKEKIKLADAEQNYHYRDLYQQQLEALEMEEQETVKITELETASAKVRQSKTFNNLESWLNERGFKVELTLDVEKGMYDPKAKKVYLNPNRKDVMDIFMHEAVHTINKKSPEYNKLVTVVRSMYESTGDLQKIEKEIRTKNKVTKQEDINEELVAYYFEKNIDKEAFLKDLFNDNKKIFDKIKDFVDDVTIKFEKPDAYADDFTRFIKAKKIMAKLMRDNSKKSLPVKETVSEKQRRMLIAEAGKPTLDKVRKEAGYESSKDIKKTDVDKVLTKVKEEAKKAPIKKEVPLKNKTTKKVAPTTNLEVQLPVKQEIKSVESTTEDVKTTKIGVENRYAFIEKITDKFEKATSSKDKKAFLESALRAYDNYQKDGGSKINETLERERIKTKEGAKVSAENIIKNNEMFKELLREQQEQRKLMEEMDKELDEVKYSNNIGVNAKLNLKQNVELATAELLTKLKFNNDGIWFLTGWEKDNTDGGWRYRLPNLKMKIKVDRDLTRELSQLVDADKLFKAYPELKNVQVKISYPEFEKSTKGISDRLQHINNQYAMDLYKKLNGEAEARAVQYTFINNPNNVRTLDNSPNKIKALMSEKTIDFAREMEKIEAKYGISMDDVIDRMDAIDKRYAKAGKLSYDENNNPVIEVLLEKSVIGNDKAIEHVLVHEIQHWIQDKEGHAMGGNTSMFEALNELLHEKSLDPNRYSKEIDASLKLHKKMVAPFKSKLETIVFDKVRMTVQKDDFLRSLKKAQVSQDELAWSGILEFLEDKKTINREELQSFLRLNVKEPFTELRLKNSNPLKSFEFLDNYLKPIEDVGTPQYTGYVVPGKASNYTEILFQSNKELSKKYFGPHWESIPNVVAHARIDTRYDMHGNEGVFINEIQSDLHQTGRKEGYNDRREKLFKEYKKLMNEIEIFNKKNTETIKDLSSKQNLGTATTLELAKLETLIHKLNRLNSQYSLHKAHRAGYEYYQGTPRADYENSWHEYVFRRMLRIAAETNKDFVALAKGEDVVKLYPGLNEKQIKGLKFFYDEVLPKYIDRYVKKWNAKLETISLPGQHSELDFDFTGKNIKVEDVMYYSEKYHYSKEKLDSSESLDDWSDMYAKNEISFLLSSVATVMKTRGLDFESALTEMLSSGTKQFSDTTLMYMRENKLLDDMLQIYETPTYNEFKGVYITPEMKESVLYEGQNKFSVDVDAKLKQFEKKNRKSVDEKFKEQLNLQPFKPEDFLPKQRQSNRVLMSPLRIAESIFNKEKAREINNKIMERAILNDGLKTDYVNKKLEVVRNDIMKKYNINLNTKRGRLIDAVAQKIGEGKHVVDGDLVTYNMKNLEQDLVNEKDREAALVTARYIKNEYVKSLNDLNNTLTNMGFEPIEARKDYFAHFKEIPSIMSGALNVLNMESDLEAYARGIFGETRVMKPSDVLGKMFFANANRRVGIDTDYGAIKGFEKYVESSAEIIYHTEDVERLKYFKKFIVQEKVKLVKTLENQNKKQYESMIKGLNSLESILDRYIKDVSGKSQGAIGDAFKEVGGGKNTINNLSAAIARKVGHTLIPAKLSSFMINFDTSVNTMAKTELKYTLQAFVDFISNLSVDDGYAAQSRFLTTRKGRIRLNKTMSQAALEGAYLNIHVSDVAICEISHRAKYLEYRGHGHSHEKAMAMADIFTAKNMPDRTKWGMSQVMRDKGLRLFTQFMIEPINKFYNMYFDPWKTDYAYERNKKFDTKEKADAYNKLIAAQHTGQAMIGAYFFNELMFKLIGRRIGGDLIGFVISSFSIGGDEDKDEEEKAKAIMEEVFRLIPYADIAVGSGRFAYESLLPKKNIQWSSLFKSFDGLSEKEIKTLTDRQNAAKRELIKQGLQWGLPYGGGMANQLYTAKEVYSKDTPGVYTSDGKLMFPVEDTPLEKLKVSLFGPWSTENAKIYNKYKGKTLGEEKIKNFSSGSLPFKEYREYTVAIDKIEGDKDYKGDTIINSRKMNRYRYIDRLPLNKKDKEQLFKYADIK